MDMLIYAIYPILLVALFWGAKVYGPKSWNDEFLTLKQTKALQGMTAICIMLHHTGQKTCAPWLMPQYIIHGLDFFVPIGYCFVSVFMFCSGYGLFKSYKTKPNYLKGFIGKRILPVILAYYVTGYFFVIIKAIMGERMGGIGLVAYILGIRLGNPNSWFVAALPFFYFAFYFAFKKCKKENTAILLVCLFDFVYTMIGTFVPHNHWYMCGEWWYNATHLFCIGLIIAKNEEAVVRHVKKFYWLYLILMFIGANAFYILSEYAQAVVGFYGEDMGLPPIITSLRRWVCLSTQMATACCFVLFLFLVGMKIKIGNKFLAFMGGITMEFYLLHGLFIELFGFNFLDFLPSIYYIKNVALFVVIIFVPTIPMALGLKKLLSILTKLLTKRKMKA